MIYLMQGKQASPGPEHMIYLTQGKQASHYTTNAAFHF
jgi:hypothetical protein